MFDFISYVRDSGLQVRILPPTAGVLISLEVRDPATGYCERQAITDRDAAKCSNIDKYTGAVLDSMAARIGARRRSSMPAGIHPGRCRKEKTFSEASNL